MKTVISTFRQGPEAGYSFNVAQVENSAEAISTYGEEFVAACVNKELAVKTAAKVRTQKVPVGTDEQIGAALLVGFPSKNLFSADEALAYRPGVRGPSFGDLLNDTFALLGDGKLSQEEAMARLVALKRKKRATKTA